MEKLTHKNPIKALCLIILAVVIVNLMAVSVSAFEFDNIKVVKETIGRAGYKNIEIENAFGLGSVLWKGELEKNTNTCGTDCSAELIINLTTDGSLIDDIYFYKINKDNSQTLGSIKSSKFSIQTGTEEIDVNDYETKCTEKEIYIPKNDSYYTEKTDCKKVLTGSHKENIPTWKEYKLGEELEAGNYNVKIEGTKNDKDSYEWIIKSQGIVMEEWATWDGSSTLMNGLRVYYPFDTGSGANAIDSRGFLDATGDDIDNSNWHTGKLNTAIDYDGAGVGMILDNTNFTTNGKSYSISFWVNTTKSADYNCALGKRGAEPWFMGMWSNNIGLFDGVVKGGWEFYATPPASLFNGTWQHVVMVRSTTASSSKVYVNGISLAVTGSTVDNMDTTASAGMGGAGDGGSSYVYVGGMDEFGYWNRTLTIREVADLYNNGTALAYPIYTAPVITTTLNEPADYINSTTNSIAFNCSSITTAPNSETIQNISLYINTTGVWKLNETKEYNGNLYETAIFNKNLPDGTYKWNCIGWDNLTNDWGTNRTITIDTANPTITINLPTSLLDYGSEGMNENLNWSITDSNFDSVWYNYNGTDNVTIYGAINSSTFILGSSPYNITVWANDSLGNVGSTYFEWVYRIFENSQTYVDSTLEGITNDFIVDVDYTSADWNVILGTLNYNNTNYPGTKTGTGDNAIFTSGVSAPNVNSEKNISFYWTMGLTNTTSTYYFNSSTYNQTVNIINMSLCGHPYTTPFMNYTIYDEAIFTKLNGIIDLTFTYRGVGSSVSNTFSYAQPNATIKSTYDFCINPAYSTYTIDSILSYDAPDYIQRYYNFEGITFTNTTTEIGLYLLNDTSSTSFLVVVQDENYQPLTGVEIYMQIYHAGNWETVEIATTNDDGETINHIYTEDSIYRFKIYEDGVLLHTTTGSVISCPSTPCTVTITISEEIDSVLPDFEDLDSLTSTIDYNKDTKFVTYTYTDTSSNFTRGRLYVTRYSLGEVNISYVCNTTNAVSTAVMTCDLTNAENGTYIATGYITRDNELTVEKIAFQKIMGIVEIIGLDGVLWSIFLLIGILMLGVYRPSLGIIFGIIGVFLMSLLGLMQITITALVALIGVAIILLIEVKKQ